MVNGSDEIERVGNPIEKNLHITCASHIFAAVVFCVCLRAFLPFFIVCVCVQFCI